MGGAAFHHCGRDLDFHAGDFQPMIEATDVTAIFGQRGSGKTELGKTISGMYRRRIVIDILGEWKKSDGADLITNSFDAAAGFLKRKIGAPGNFTLVFQFDINSKSDYQKKLFNAVLHMVWKRGNITGENACLVIEEAHEYCGPNWSEEWLRKCTMVGRHANLAMIISSQRPASVDKALISQAKNVLIGRLFEFRDIEYIRQTIGDDADLVPKLKQYQFLFRRENEPVRIVDKFKFGAKR